ncbi:Transcription termination factor Rho [Escherichia coli]|nr:Transcription termination factor Rho [Escherichia coli]
MNLTELKNTPVSELITLGENMGLENLARMRKQDIIFAILKQHAKSGEDIFGDGVLEILQDGFGFSVPQTAPTPVLMTSTFPLAKSAVSTSALVIPSLVRFARRKKVNAILRC